MENLFKIEEMIAPKTRSCLWCSNIFWGTAYVPTFRGRMYFCSEKCIVQWLIKEGRMKDPNKGIRGWLKRIFLKAA